MKKFNKNVSSVENTTIDEIRKWQSKHKVLIPSDYVYFLLHHNGLRIVDGYSYEITNSDGQPLVEIDEIIQLEHLEGELPLIREIEKEDKVEILNRFCPMVRTVSKIILLVGTSIDNLNQIFVWNYELYNDEDSPERLHKIADNIFDLLNNNLRKCE